jgi:long-chain fatty acid transport protein
MKKLTLVLAVALLAAAPAAMATNGYFTHGNGTLSKSMAGAGVALPREAMDTANNPAAAAFVERSGNASLALFSPDRQYSVSGDPSNYPQTLGLTPGTVESESNYFPMPALAMTFRPSDTTGFAVSMIARGGMNTNYHASTFYGSGQTGVDLAQMFLSGTYGRKITQNHALGISLIGVGQRFKASGLEAFGNFSDQPAALSNNGYDYSYGLGVQLGYLGYLTPDLSIGATFTPQILMSEFKDYSGLFAENGSFDIPAAVNAGIAYKATDKVTLALDYQRIHYSDVSAVGQHLFPGLMQSPLGADDGAGFGWDDVNVVKLGVAWQATPDWMFSAGFSKANQPIPASEVLFNILAPAVIEQHVTLGTSKALGNERGTFNVAVMYAPTQTVKGPNPLEAPGAQQIELKMNEWEIEFGYSFGF